MNTRHCLSLLFSSSLLSIWRWEKVWTWGLGSRGTLTAADRQVTFLSYWNRKRSPNFTARWDRRQQTSLHILPSLFLLIPLALMVKAQLHWRSSTRMSASSPAEIFNWTIMTRRKYHLVRWWSSGHPRGCPEDVRQCKWALTSLDLLPSRPLQISPCPSRPLVLIASVLLIISKRKAAAAASPTTRQVASLGRRRGQTDWHASYNIYLSLYLSLSLIYLSNIYISLSLSPSFSLSLSLSLSFSFSLSLSLSLQRYRRYHEEGRAMDQIV
jgi:hypothetical protein